MSQKKGKFTYKLIEVIFPIIMPTTNQRQTRYKEKLELIEERIDDVEFLVSDFDDKIKRLACYKAFQEIVEGIFDIISMIIKDKEKIVTDDYSNLEKLEKLGIINPNDVRVLQSANGLRNRVIHKYNQTDDDIARESMITLLPTLRIIVKKLTKR